MEPFEFLTAVGSLVIISITVVKLANIFTNRNRAVADSPQLQRLEERLVRMEQAIDAVSVEVERISEGQRFTTKLLAERAKEPA